MRLFAANVSFHHQTIYYRNPKGNGLLHHELPPGAQNIIQNDSLEEGEINQILAQVERYGMVRFEDAEQIEKDKRVVVLFAVDKPIPAKIIEKHFNRNRGILTEEGEERRVEMAVANVNSIENIQEGAGRTVDLSVEEEEPGTITRQSGNRPLGEGFANEQSEMAKRGARNMDPRKRRR